VASDVPEPAGAKPRDTWWGWGVAKIALEAQFARGTLAIADRRKSDWARVYDLTERVLPALARLHPPERSVGQRELLRRAARAHGIGTAADLADYYRIPVREARATLAELVAANELQVVRVEGWREVAYLDPNAALPRRIDACSLLSPFDPIVWRRSRVARLFDFDYVLEIWTPPAKRRWGYFVLPFLFGERLVARVDLKADRERQRLLVQAAYAEAHAPARQVAPALAAELRTLARWLELDAVAVRRRGNLARALAVAVRA
jgi:uncharacterized protein YcaQ